MFTWVCDIPGADAATSAWHLTLQLGLAAFVVVGGIVFLALAVIAYRRPPELRRGAGLDPGPVALATTAD